MFLPIKEWNYDEILNKVIPLKNKRSVYNLQGVVMEDRNGKFKNNFGCRNLYKTL